MRRLLLALFAVSLAPLAWGNPPERLQLATPVPALAGESCTKIGLLGGLMTRETQLTRTFLDDFDDLDLQKGPWSPHYAHAIYSNWQSRTLAGNEERQIYVDENYKGSGDRGVGVKPHQIKDGILHLMADETKKSAEEALDPFDYTSGMISSHGHFTQTYGYFEIKARVPKGQGLWPAFWLLRPGLWPPEIDVMEVLGHDPDTLHATVHWSAAGAHIKSGCSIAMGEADEGFRLYGALWTRDMIVHYLDRQPVAVTRTKPGLDGPMYLIANLAVGGRWPGDPDETTVFPASFQIDWIAAYQLENE